MVSNDALGSATERSPHHSRQFFSTEVTSRYKGSNGGGKNHSGCKKQGFFHCDHCHIIEHTIDICYKLHGYPSTHSKHSFHKKVVNTAHGQDSDTLSNFNPSFTSEQYSYLITLNNKEKELDHIKNVTANESSNSAFWTQTLLYPHESLWVLMLSWYPKTREN